MGNLRWTPRLVTKTSTQIDPRSPQSMVQIENVYTGDDFNASVKVLNPSIMEGGLTAIVIADYMQSVTPKLALGLEGVWQRNSLGAKPETALSYAARYKTVDWIASAQVHASGQLGATYWRRLSDKVEAGVDCQLQFAPGMGGAGMFGGIRKEGQTTVGVKYNFLTSVYRAQIDSAGKVGCVLEKRVAPAITFSFAAEIDQWKVKHNDPYAMSDILTNRILEHAQAWPRCIARRQPRRTRTTDAAHRHPERARPTILNVPPPSQCRQLPKPSSPPFTLNSRRIFSNVFTTINTSSLSPCKPSISLSVIPLHHLETKVKTLYRQSIKGGFLRCRLPPSSPSLPLK